MGKDEELSRSLEAASGKAKPAKTPQTPPRKQGVGNVAASLSPKAARQAPKAAEVRDEVGHDTAMRMAFIGAGQGGSRIADSFWGLGYRRVCVFNTTHLDFKGIDDGIQRLSIDTGGAAKDMLFARKSLEGRDEEVWDLMQRAWGSGGVDCALVCVGLGGGSGSGAGLPLVGLARKFLESRGLPQRVGVVVSLPSVDEGPQVARNAVDAFQELLSAKVSPIVVIDNDKVHELYDPPMSRLLPKSNELVSSLLHVFNTLAATHSEHITFDRSEFAQLLDGGVVVFGSADIPVEEIKSPADVSTRIREELAANVLASVDLRTGRKAACVFVAEQKVLDTFGKDYFSAGFTQLNRIVGSGDSGGRPSVVHRGIYLGEFEGLQCYTMISELEPPHEKLKALARVAGARASDAPGSAARYLGVDDGR